MRKLLIAAAIAAGSLVGVNAAPAQAGSDCFASLTSATRMAGYCSQGHAAYRVRGICRTGYATYDYRYGAYVSPGLNPSYANCNTAYGFVPNSGSIQH
jgi:hypothetical protein